MIEILDWRENEAELPRSPRWPYWGRRTRRLRRIAVHHMVGLPAPHELNAQHQSEGFARRAWGPPWSNPEHPAPPVWGSHPAYDFGIYRREGIAVWHNHPYERGWATGDANDDTVAVALTGDRREGYGFDLDAWEAAALDHLLDFIVVSPEFNWDGPVPAYGAVYGHRELAPGTACPGDLLLDNVLRARAGEPFTGQLHNGGEASMIYPGFSAVSADDWLCQQTGKHVRFAILSFFRAYPDAVDLLGYPLSDEWQGADGFTYQLFQRALLQWHTTTGVRFANGLQELLKVARDGAPDPFGLAAVWQSFAL